MSRKHRRKKKKQEEKKQKLQKASVGVSIVPAEKRAHETLEITDLAYLMDREEERTSGKEENEPDREEEPEEQIEQANNGLKTASDIEADAEDESPVVLRFRNVSIDYRVREGLVKSVERVSFDVKKGLITAIIGESGSGKSTLTGAVLRVLAPNGKISPESRILFYEKDILQMNRFQLQRFRWQKASMVFQAAQNALNPTLKIYNQIMDSVIDHGMDPDSDIIQNRLTRLLSMVRLDPNRVLKAYPHELSGGMRQRVIIALAMILEPEFIILDEPTTALDVITQHYIFDILREIHEKTGQTMIFITHDMSAVAKLADIIGVMYAGKIFELAPAGDLFENPLHPYTIGLLGSIPSIQGDEIKRKPIAGLPPDLINKPGGCVFHPRCQYAVEKCRKEEPVFVDIGKDHFVACHRGGSFK